MKIIKLSDLSLEWEVFKEYKSFSGKISDKKKTTFREYRLGGEGKNGIVTVDLNKNGYQIRNIFVDEKYKRMGYASLIYKMLNQESLLVTGKPLRSSEIGYKKEDGVTSLSDDGVKLWENFLDKGEVTKKDKYYEFLSKL